MADDPGSSVFNGLIQRGYSPVQAAALAGHAVQESGGNPGAVNPKEDAHGLLQWRLDRWQNLQNFAKERGVDPSDPNLQLDFIGKEMAGPEARAGAKFTAAPDLPSASAALKSYIRFGDNSAPTRLANAQGILSGRAGMLTPSAGATPSAAPVPASGPAPVAPASTAPISPAPEPDDGGQLQASLQGIQKMLAQPAPEPQSLNLTPPAPIQPPPMTPAMIRARQLAQAMRSRQLTGNA